MKTLLEKLNEKKGGKVFVELDQVENGQLFKFKGQSEVYRMDDVGYFSECYALYAEKKVTFKKYHEKNGASTVRTVEIVESY